MTYLAHSDPKQKLADHLEAVGRLAAILAERARPGDEEFRKCAEIAGYLHDFGKYTDCFQKMLEEGRGRCKHSAHGAAIANGAGCLDVAFAIAGHHGGIP